MIELSDSDFNQLVFARRSELLEIQATAQKAEAARLEAVQKALDEEKEALAAEEKRKADLAEAARIAKENAELAC